MVKKERKPVIKKQWLIIAGGLLVLAGGLVAFKALVLNKPDETPREITEKIVSYIQTKNPDETQSEAYRTYFTEEAKKELQDVYGEDAHPSEDSDTDVPVVTLKDVQESGDVATATIELEAWIIKLPVQFKFVKLGNFLTGYEWKINDVIGLSGDSVSGGEKIELTVKANEEADIGSGLSIKTSAPVNYVSNNEFEQPEKGFKLVAIELVYKNTGEKSKSVDPMNLKIRDTEGHSYDMTFMGSKKPEFSGNDTVTAAGSLKGWVTYEIPSTAVITSAVYANDEATVTINF